MKAIDELRKEHEGILLMLHILEAVSQKIQQGDRIDPDNLDKMVEFLSVFADKCHHGKEEDFLFPALEASGIPRKGGPIGVMLEEHKMGRSLIAKLKESASLYRSGDEKSPGNFASAASEYIELLRQHINKENNILFPMADNVFSAKSDKELFNSFERLEHDRIGPGKHEEFHALLKQLSEKYLN
ncbi:MAG: hemerythrin domain-containing protein [Acidobacteriota bacterium]|jgi:hemerythrin-like domain-containing protein